MLTNDDNKIKMLVNRNFDCICIINVLDALLLFRTNLQEVLLFYLRLYSLLLYVNITEGIGLGNQSDNYRNGKKRENIKNFFHSYKPDTMRTNL